MSFKMKRQPTAEETTLLQRCADSNLAVAMVAQRELAQALTLPLKQGVLKGDILAGIFQTVNFLPGTSTEFPLDWLSPGSEKDHMAYTIPNVGRIPERTFEGDYIMVPTYRVGNSIDWNLKYAREARWDVVGRALQALEAGFVRKANGDGWHVILAAAAARNIMVYDSEATAGLFTKRLVVLMQNLMRRNAGGNSTSLNRGKLTDLYISPEAHGDVLAWDLTQIPDAIRQQIFQNWDAGGVGQIGSVKLHDIDELGESQEFQTYYTSILAGSMSSDKKEIVVGLDLDHDDSFVNPVRQEVEIFEDPTFHRSGRAGMYGWREHGFSVLDNRRVLLGCL